jgi:polyisoprenoid-binding protein YceI
MIHPLRTAIALAAWLAAALPAAADAVPYRLDAARSVVGFETDFGGGAAVITGRMPIAAARLAIDFDKVSRSRFEVTVSAAEARTSNPLATEAMKSATVLDTARHPEIRFVSTSVRAAGAGAEVEGDMTIRGVTRPVTLTAQIYRQKGAPEGDRSRLSILLTGAVSRGAFGAGGFPDMVGDEVRLKILARIDRAGG